MSLPAAYALVRYPVPGHASVFSLLQLPLYVPGAVIGLSLLLTYTFTYQTGVDVGPDPRDGGRDVPVDADTDRGRDEGPAARCSRRPPSASARRGWQTYRRIVFPLIGPGVSAGLLLCFIIVFNEYLVTLFVHPTDHRDGTAAGVQSRPHERPRSVDRGAGRHHAARLVRRGPGLLPDLRDAALQGHVHPLMATVQRSSRSRSATARPWPSTTSTSTSRTASCVTLLGPSGCGKTTTLRMIAGLIEPTGGPDPVRRRGHDLHAAAQAEHRLRLPDAGPVPASLGRRQHRVRAVGQGRSQGGHPRRGSTRCWPWSGSTATALACRPSCRAASSSASRSPGCWPPILACCCSTSRSRRSTGTCATS